MGTIILMPIILMGAYHCRYIFVIDQFLALTERISIVAETTDAPDARAQLFEALALLKTFLAKDSQAKCIAVPTSTSGPTRIIYFLRVSRHSSRASSVILSPPEAHSSFSRILFARHGTISATSGSTSARHQRTIAPIDVSYRKPTRSASPTALSCSPPPWSSQGLAVSISF